MVSLNIIREKHPEEVVRNINLSQIMRCILGLSPSEIEIYNFLKRIGSDDALTVNEISKIMGKSRSTVERALIKLVQLGLVGRRAVLARNGGYTYIYYAKPMDHIRQRLLDLLNAYYEKARDVILKQ